MFKQIFITFIFLVSISLSYAQNSYFSPYSRYGIGDIADKNFGQAKAMGKSSIALRSKEHLNLNNPASYSEIDSLNFIFEVGYFNKYTNYSTNSQSINKNDASGWADIPAEGGRAEEEKKGKKIMLNLNLGSKMTYKPAIAKIAPEAPTI